MARVQENLVAGAHLRSDGEVVRRGKVALGQVGAHHLHSQLRVLHIARLLGVHRQRLRHLPFVRPHRLPEVLQSQRLHLRLVADEARAEAERAARPRLEQLRLLEGRRHHLRRPAVVSHSEVVLRAGRGRGGRRRVARSSTARRLESCACTRAPSLPAWSRSLARPRLQRGGAAACGARRAKGACEGGRGGGVMGMASPGATSGGWPPLAVTRRCPRAPCARAPPPRALPQGRGPRPIPPRSAACSN